MATKRREVDIGSRNGYPAADLSNFFPHRFVFDRIVCASPEGLLQALKFEDFADQKKVCKLCGIEAKRTGRKHNGAWQSVQTLWWRGRPYDRGGPEYQELLDRIFWSLSKNADFRKALAATGNKKLIHSVGESDCRKTVLTEAEFCGRLTRIRKALKKGTLS